MKCFLSFARCESNYSVPGSRLDAHPSPPNQVSIPPPSGRNPHHPVCIPSSCSHVPARIAPRKKEKKMPQENVFYILRHPTAAKKWQEATAAPRTDGYIWQDRHRRRTEEKDKKKKQRNSFTNQPHSSNWSSIFVPAQRIIWYVPIV